MKSKANLNNNQSILLHVNDLFINKCMWISVHGLIGLRGTAQVLESVYLAVKEI